MFSTPLAVLSTPVHAEPETSETTSSEQTQADSSQTTDDATTTTEETQDAPSTNVCYDESGSLGWLICPTTGFLARVVDGLYGVIEGLLVLKPLTTDSDSPYHQIWAIFRDFTNVVFVIFFLVIIYSQLTGVGISNYGIKKLLPKIIVSAILINLSYIICAALVDVSNIAGSSLRGVFQGVEDNITATGLVANATEGVEINYSGIVSGLVGGTFLGGLAISVTGGFGALFISLIPVLLGAVVAVAIAYLTIAARQAFVYLLIMVSPLAFVCNLLPNTEKWFGSWKKSLSQMLFFYPLFAALFGACSLVGWTIIAAAEDALTLIMGIAVRVIPLFAAWPLLKMSGTIPGQLNSALTNLSAKPLGIFRNYTAEQAALRRAKYLGEKPRDWQYGRALAQHNFDVKNRRLSDTKKYLEMANTRSAAFASNIHTSTGAISRRGRKMTALQAQVHDYQRQALRNANDMDKGLAHYAKNDKDKEKLKAIDHANMTAADDLYIETGRGEKIRFDNAQSRADRINAAFDANSGAIFNASRGTQPARIVNSEDLARFKRINSALEGDLMGTHLIGANAAYDYSSQTALLGKKFDAYFTSLPPTQELYDRLFQLTGTDTIAKDIDPILTGMKALNMRGDTDLVTNVMRRIVETKQIRLGTHASQAIANFCMFDVKDSDVLLRRYGKYINLETARVFNEGQSKGKRKNDTLSFKEYITGEYDEYDDSGNLVKNLGRSKLSVAPLLMGTSLNGAERTTFENLDANLRLAYTDEHGNVDIEKFKAKRNEVNNAMLPAIITAALTFPSGSEQGINLASYITGLKANGDGTYTKRWEKGSDPLYGLDQDYFADFVKLYLSAQVPNQITSLRTDTFNPLVEVLADDYIDQIKRHKADPEHVPDPASILPDSAIAPSEDLPDILSQEPEKILSTDSPAEREAKRARNKDLAKRKKQARDQYAKANFMGTLHKANTLGPIIRTLASGSVGGAKRVVRDFLGVNDQDPFSILYKDELKKIRNDAVRRARASKRAEAPTEEQPEEPASETGGDSAPLYDDAKREDLKQTYSDWIDERGYADEEQFVEDVVEDLQGNGLDVEADEFSQYYERNPDASFEELLGLIKYILDGSANF
ncbi:hypothetical protein IKE71_01170 [Candidatus Saccharibacteria bacterium]|nr:hypothetical protein [Candidatus Saccharibacteria bacterium]